jgi:hypothetical protein
MKGKKNETEANGPPGQFVVFLFLSYLYEVQLSSVKYSKVQYMGRLSHDFPINEHCKKLYTQKDHILASCFLLPSLKRHEET